MLVFSELVKVTRRVSLLPVGTLPNATLGGLAVNDLPDTPQPRTLNWAALLLNAMFPLSSPVAAGLKVTVKLALCPGAKVSGNANWFTVYPAAFTLIVDTVMLVDPLLVIVAAKISVWPITTSPKRKFAGLKVS